MSTKSFKLYVTMYSLSDSTAISSTISSFGSFKKGRHRKNTFLRSAILEEELDHQCDRVKLCTIQHKIYPYDNNLEEKMVNPNSLNIEKSFASFKDGKLVIQEAISDTEYKTYKLHQGIIASFGRRHQLIECVDLNYHEYENYLYSVIEQYPTSHVLEPNILEDISLNSNRLILNFLSIYKTFIDHAAAMLVREFGNDSNEFKQFKSFLSQKYENEFFYRFLYKFRNYCQHCGMPNLSYKVSIERQPDNSYEYSLTLSLSSKELLNKYNGWGTFVREVLLSQPEAFDIHPLLFELYRVLRSAYIIFVRAFKFDLVLESKLYINSCLQKFNAEGHPCVTIGSISNEELNMEITDWVPVNILKKVEMVETLLNQQKDSI